MQVVRHRADVALVAAQRTHEGASAAFLLLCGECEALLGHLKVAAEAAGIDKVQLAGLDLLPAGPPDALPPVPPPAAMLQAGPPAVQLAALQQALAQARCRLQDAAGTLDGTQQQLLSRASERARVYKEKADDVPAGEVGVGEEEEEDDVGAAGGGEEEGQEEEEEGSSDEEDQDVAEASSPSSPPTSSLLTASISPSGLPPSLQAPDAPQPAAVLPPTSVLPPPSVLLPPSARQPPSAVSNGRSPVNTAAAPLPKLTEGLPQPLKALVPPGRGASPRPQTVFNLKDSLSPVWDPAGSERETEEVEDSSDEDVSGVHENEQPGITGFTGCSWDPDTCPPWPTPPHRSYGPQLRRCSWLDRCAVRLGQQRDGSCNAIA